MSYDPHALHQILVKIREQMRCPQCSATVDVGFPSVKLAGDDFVLLQVQCLHCQAFIVLHVTVTGAVAEKIRNDLTKNASSNLHVDEAELETLRTALGESGGSFEKLFALDASTQKNTTHTSSDAELSS